MRIIVIADFADASGGGQLVALQSAVALARRGLAVTYVQGVAGALDPRLAAAGVEVLSLGLSDVWDRPAAAAAVSGIWNRQAARRLEAALAAFSKEPVILHLHQWTRALSPAVFPVLLRTGHPLVVTLHDYFVACPNGVYYRFDRESPCQLVPLSAACAVAPCDPRSSAHKAIRFARTVATRRALGRSRIEVIHVSDRGRDTMAPFLPAGIGQHRIDNPVEVAQRRPAALAPGSRIAFVGRLTREKGADLVAAAAAAAGLRALFIGEGPAEPDIRRLAPGAEILGWRPRAEIERLLETAVLAVAAPSRWYETGPLTVYEALAAGVPPIVSARAGASEKVVHGETGLVVQPTVEALSAAFRAIATGETASRMGRTAYGRYWAAPLDGEAHGAALVQLYDGLLGRAGMRRAA